MTETTLDRVTKEIQEEWNGLTSHTVLRTRELLKELTLAPDDEPWLAKIHAEKPETVELYADPEQGYILLAHTERKGLYRVPHNHGAGWVFYAVQHGENRMSTYKQTTTPDGRTHLVSRGSHDLRKGDCEVFLPGDIHDTECLTDYMVQFRLTSSDFKQEKTSGRMIQFVDASKVATAPLNAPQK